jgi:putative methyltransferase (TIGR04325 family)
VSRVRSVVRAVTPPVVLDAARRVRERGPNAEWEYVGPTWPAAQTTGWNEASVVAAQKARWPALDASARGPQPFGADRDSAPGFAELVSHNAVLNFAYAIGLASVGRSRVAIMDWGGGLGYYGLLARGLFPTLDFDYHCHDLTLMVAQGRRLLPDATFHDSSDEALSHEYDLVVASSAIHYVEDWKPLFGKLAAATAGYLLIARQPSVDRVDSFVVVQRPKQIGYLTEYPGWIINRGEFLKEAGHAGLRLVRELLTGEQARVPGAPEMPVLRGFIFAAANARERTSESGAQRAD